MIKKTVPTPRNPTVDPHTVILKSFSRLDPRALGLATGVVTGTTLLAATLFLVLKGGESVGANLGLLSQFFAGYSVSVPGAVFGFIWAFGAGFCWGWAIA